MGDSPVQPGPAPHEHDHRDPDRPDADDPATKAYWDRLEGPTDAEQTMHEDAMLEHPGSPACPDCGLTGELRTTLARGWVLLEPADVTELLPAHFVPPRQRWYLQPDGVAWNSWHAEPVPGAVCRLNHRLVCPGLAGSDRPDPWPWLTAVREENERRARRRDEAAQLEFGRDEPA